MYYQQIDDRNIKSDMLILQNNTKVDAIDKQMAYKIQSLGSFKSLPRVRSFECREWEYPYIGIGKYFLGAFNN